MITLENFTLEDYVNGSVDFQELIEARIGATLIGTSNEPFTQIVSLIDSGVSALATLTNLAAVFSNSVAAGGGFPNIPDGAFRGFDKVVGGTAIALTITNDLAAIGVNYFEDGDVNAAINGIARIAAGVLGGVALGLAFTVLGLPISAPIALFATGYAVGQFLYDNSDLIIAGAAELFDFLENQFDELISDPLGDILEFLLGEYAPDALTLSLLNPFTALSLLFGNLSGLIDPLVIDLDGDGVNTTSVNDSGVTFDLDNNGSEESVGWFEAEDGILVQDWKGAVDEDGKVIGDGQAQDRSELFATFDELSRHDLNGDGILDASDVAPKATQDTNGDGEINADDVILPDDLEDVNGDGLIDINDVSEFAQDTNGDGIITEDEIEQPTFTADLDGDGVLDTVNVGYDQVNVWIDANQNGNVDEGELQSLEEAGITSIDLNETPLANEDNGNIINSESTVTFEDGSTAVINGIDLFRDTIDQSYEQQINNLDLTPERLAA